QNGARPAASRLDHRLRTCVRLTRPRADAGVRPSRDVCVEFQPLAPLTTPPPPLRTGPGANPHRLSVPTLRDALEMQLVAQALDALGVQSRERFLRNF